MGLGESCYRSDGGGLLVDWRQAEHLIPTS
jgi:hypothetical protein